MYDCCQNTKDCDCLAMPLVVTHLQSMREERGSVEIHIERRALYLNRSKPSNASNSDVLSLEPGLLVGGIQRAGSDSFTNPTVISPCE